MRKNSTLRSLCSVNDDKLVIRSISGVDDERMEIRLVKDHIFDRKYFEFDDYLKMYEVSVSIGLQEEFNEAIYDNRMLNFLANHSKRGILFHGRYIRCLLPNIKSSRICTYAKRPFTTLNYMTRYTSEGATIIDLGARLRYLSHKSEVMK